MATNRPVIASALKPNPLRSLLHRLLLRTFPYRDKFWASSLWYWAKRRTQGWNTPVKAIIHGREAIIPFNYAYPHTCRQFRTFNNPLLELVNLTCRAQGRAIRLVDVGAAVGDTVLLIEGNCPGMVEEYVCIDGDAEFFLYLTENARFLPKARCILQLLCRSDGQSRSLVRTHASTASAQGEEFVASKSLDHVLDDDAVGPIDLLKVDVDGFDGEVISGFLERMRSDKPTVIFEWHPALIRQTGNNPLAAFKALETCGYECLLWFTKEGAFSHFSNVGDTTSFELFGKFCESTTAYTDWHFDVVALHRESRIDALELAELRFARNRRSQF